MNRSKVANWLWLAAAALTSAAAAQPCVPGWEVLPLGPNFITHAMQPYEEAGKTSLFVAGNFNHAGGVPTGPIARWDGASWSAVGSVFFNKRIHAMTIVDEPFGRALYVGGRFTPSGGFDANGVARWDGTVWSPASAGLELMEEGVGSLLVHDAGDGPFLYAGGRFWFTAHGFNGPRHFGRWNGQVWEPAGDGAFGPIHNMISHHNGQEQMLYAFGHILPGPAGLIISLGRWDGASWQDHRGSWRTATGRIIEFEITPGARELFFVGGLRDHDLQRTDGVFHWTDGDWKEIAVTNNLLYTATVWDDGSGPSLYIGGQFTTLNGEPMPRVAAWDGLNWRATGAEVLGSSVDALSGFTDEHGPVLHAAGPFPNPAGGLLHFAQYRTCFIPEPCYGNCDGSTTEPILNVSDFVCFINESPPPRASPTSSRSPTTQTATTARRHPR